MQATGVRQRGMAYGCGTVRVGQGRDVLSGQARVVRHVEQQRVGGWRANHAANTLACIAQEWGQIGRVSKSHDGCRQGRTEDEGEADKVPHEGHDGTACKHLRQDADCVDFSAKTP